VSTLCDGCPDRPLNGEGCNPCKALQTPNGPGTSQSLTGLGGDSRITAATSRKIQLVVPGDPDFNMDRGNDGRWGFVAPSRKVARRMSQL